MPFVHRADSLPIGEFTDPIDRNCDVGVFTHASVVEGLAPVRVDQRVDI
jgi:hypothetical protein